MIFLLFEYSRKNFAPTNNTTKYAADYKKLNNTKIENVNSYLKKKN